MKRRVVFKNIDQKLACNNSVYRNTRALDLRKRSIALNHDQGTCLYLSHLKGCAGDLVYGLFRIALLTSGIFGNKKIRDEIFTSELFERFPQLRLEDDNESRQHELAHMVDDPCDRIQVERSRQKIKADYDQASPQKHSRSRRLYP